MRILRRNHTLLILSFVLVGLVASWATSAMAAKPERMMLPVSGLKAACATGDTIEDDGGSPHPGHAGTIDGIGSYVEIPIGTPPEIMVEVGDSFLTKAGQKVVPLKVLSMGGRNFAEGVGETQFWLDPSRPVTSAIWEKTPGTEFPAIQEMRFHFFYTVEAMPGKVFRSINPSIMRSDNVTSFPPAPGTVYRLVQPVELEDVKNPGVVVGRLISNQVILPGRKPHNNSME